MENKQSGKFLLVFALTTLFFIVQHSIRTSWDFASYVLNAKYFLGISYYFEPLRPPLMPLLIALLSIHFGWMLAEYAYIILASFLFALALHKFCQVFRLDKLSFYMLFTTPYFLMFALINGTELLALALVVFFLVRLKESKPSSHALALAFLTRYELVTLLPLLFLHKKAKKIILNFAVFSVLILPWLIFNYVKFGNLFASIADSYALNIYYRQDVFMPLNIWHFLQVFNFLLPFFVVGVILAVLKIFRKGKNAFLTFTMLYVLFSAFYFYYSVPLKMARFLFLATLPITYFSYLTISSIFENPSKIITLIWLAYWFYIVFTLPVYLNYSTGLISLQTYKQAMQDLKELNLSNCSVMSNEWVYLNYFGQASKPSPWPQTLGYYLNKGHVILIFYNNEPSYASNKSFLNQFPKIHETEDYIILKNQSIACPSKEVFNKLYLEILNETLRIAYNESINKDFCDYFAKPISFVCKIANLKV